jgi:hypothetical protein
MRALRTGALLLAFWLTACGHAHTVAVKPAVVPPPPQPTRPLVSVPGPAELPEYPVPELKPGTEGEAAPVGETVNGGNQTQSGAAASEGAAPSAPATAPADYDPDRLVGLSEAEATNLLGAPVEKTDSPPSRIWTYRSPTCEVKLFFYPEVGATTYRTLTYEINDQDPADTTHGACVGGLVKAHAG